MRAHEALEGWTAGRQGVPRRQKGTGLRPMDGVIMLGQNGQPAAGAFPDNVWLVMGSEDDSIEDFFGPSRDVLTADLETNCSDDGRRYCVGYDAAEDEMVLNGRGAYPVYVSGLLKMNRMKHWERGE